MGAHDVNSLSRTRSDADVLMDMPTFAARYRNGDLTPAQYATYYVLRWQCARYGDRLAQRRSRRDYKPDGTTWFAQLDALTDTARTTRLIELLERYDLRGVSRRVNIALAGWLRGTWLLQLREDIPPVCEVLQLQTQGMRPVTVISEYPRLAQPVLDKADGLAFVCHDLEHAWQFFHDADSHEAQKQFARQLYRALGNEVFTEYLGDADFAEKFDYLAADMNTHPAHSFHYLRAILLEFHLRQESKGPADQLSPAARLQMERCLAALSDGRCAEKLVL